MKLIRPILLAAMLASLAPAAAMAGPGGLPGSFILLVATSRTPPTEADLQKLIGHSLHDTGGNYLGSIEAIHVARNNHVQGVVVGLAQANGTIDHDIVLAWNSLQIASDADRVTVNVSPRILATLPAFEFNDPDLRGKVFRDVD
jgi:hypothetical protein